MCRQAAIATPASPTSASGPSVCQSRSPKASGVSRVVLEAEPAGLRKPLDARDVVPGRAGVEHDERARQQERAYGKRNRAADSPPFAEARDDERDEKEHTGVLRGRGETGRDPRPFEPPRDEQRERHGDAEGEEHVRDGHARVRDVGRRDGDADRADETGEAAVARSPEPPGRGDARDADEDRDDPGGAVRGFVEAELGRREDEEQQARIVVPAGVEPAAVDELPRARDEVLLVGVEERQRETELRPDARSTAARREDQPEGGELDGGRRAADVHRGRVRRPGRVADERRDVSGDEHGVDPGALELLDVLSRGVGELGDRELSGGDVRQELEEAVDRRLLVLRALGREQDDLRVDVIERWASSSSSLTRTTYSIPSS